MFLIALLFPVRLYVMQQDPNERQQCLMVHQLVRPGNQSTRAFPALFLYRHNYGSLRMNPMTQVFHLNHFAALFPTIDEPNDGWDEFFSSIGSSLALDDHRVQIQID